MQHSTPFEAPPGTILIADDEELIRRVLADTLRDEGHTVKTVNNGARASEALASQAFDVALLDIRMPERSGLDILLQTQQADQPRHPPIIIMTGQTTLDNAIEAMKRGAFDYLTKPFDLEEVKALVMRALEVSRLTDSQPSPPSAAVEGRTAHMIGHGPAMQQVYKTIGRIVKSDATVLLQGESGTGKELVARVIHHHSPRWRAPFIGINCSAVPLDLLESEFFGHERGAFTGAVERRLGKFEQATDGTLFLDEVADMPPALQAKLLRVLQEREITRLGGRDVVQVNTRIIAASNQDLALAVRQQRFREDLFFRLQVVPITLPALRQRREDIPALTTYFLEKINREMGTRVNGVTPEAEAMLVHHSWPGNVRELENTLLRAAVLAPGRLLTRTDLSLPAAPPGLPENFAEMSLEDLVRRKLSAYFQHPASIEAGDVYDGILAQVEKPLIELTLEHTSGNQLRAAELLGINRNTLRKKMTSLNIEPKK